MTSSKGLAERYPTQQVARMRIHALNRKMMTFISSEEHDELIELVEIVDQLPDVPGSELAGITPPQGSLNLGFE